jgi:hypothetical protein
MLDVWIALGTGVIAVATGFAAAAAWRAATATRRTTEARLFVQLMSEYSSPEMAKAMNHLSRLADGWRKDPQGRPFEQLVDNWASIYARDRSDDQTDNAQRRVSHFYRKVTRIVQEGLLRGGLRKEMLELSGRELMYEVVIPMEQALAKHLGTDWQADVGYLNRFRRVFPPRRPRLPPGDGDTG